MNTKFENMALLNIEDYNELKAKAEATDEQIKKQAEEMAKPEVVTLKVCFDTYGLLYRPYTCVDVEIPFYDDEKIRDMLNKASADIMKWCDKNMVKYNKELKESRSTKKHCEGLRKHIANLERRLLKHAAGAEWRINSVWHSITVIPDCHRFIVFLPKKSTIGSKNPIMGILEENKTFISSRPGCILYRLDEMESWAYLDDLLP